MKTLIFLAIFVAYANAINTCCWFHRNGRLVFEPAGQNLPIEEDMSAPEHMSWPLPIEEETENVGIDNTNINTCCWFVRNGRLVFEPAGQNLPIEEDMSAPEHMSWPLPIEEETEDVGIDNTNINTCCWFHRNGKLVFEPKVQDMAKSEHFDRKEQLRSRLEEMVQKRQG